MRGKVSDNQRLTCGQAELLHDARLTKKHTLVHLTQVVGQPQLVAVVQIFRS